MGPKAKRQGNIHYEIGIVGHKAREADHPELMKLAGTHHISVDDGSLGCNRNHLKVWSELAAKPAHWLVVLEDDCVPIPDFRRQLALALAAAPTKVVSLYLGTGHPSVWQARIKTATEVADAWIVGEKLLHGVGYAMQSELVPDMLADLAHPFRTGIDSRITAWLNANRLLVGYCWPSIIDHLDEQSVIGAHPDGMPRNRPRHAWATGSREHWHSRPVLL